MRKACLDCVYKHLADAAIWEIEYHLGYPSFKLYIIGSLNHASHEAYKAHKELAWVLRQHRINWYNDPESYEVPYEALGNYVEVCAELPEEAEMPVIPDACIAGINKEPDGSPVYDADTRPD